MLHDLRAAVRAIAKDRWLASAAIVALALGIGVNATIFTLVNAVLIRGLPFADSGNLYVLGTMPLQAGAQQRINPVSYQDVQDWRAEAGSFVDIAAFSQQSFNLADDRAMAEQVTGARVSENLFRVLGQQPLLGRDFNPADGRAAAERVVVLGNALWKNRYGGDPGILGKAVRLNGDPAVVIGVMPAGMRFPTRADLWTQVVPDANAADRGRRGFSAVGRVKPGTSRAAAQAELTGLAGRLAQAYPSTNKDVGATLQTFNERFNGGEIRLIFLTLQGAVGFVLLIACANVASLQLSRAIHRAREVAVRTALGASRWRIVRQLLVESVLLGIAGGALGLLLAVGGVRLFDVAVADVGKPYWIQFTMDYVVFGFLALLCIATGIIFGIMPALQISRTNVNDVLKEEGRGTAGSRRTQWLTSTMVVVELALTLILLVGAGLMVRSFLKLYTIETGLVGEHLMTMRTNLPSVKYPGPEQRLAFYEQVLQRLETMAGAEGIALATSVPGFGPPRERIEIDGAPVPASWEERPEVGAVAVSRGFFTTTGIEILRGRPFTETDGAPGSEVMVLDQRAASQLFGDADPIGRRLRLAVQNPAAGAKPPAWRTVVGISRTLTDVPQPGATPSAGTIFVPYRQDPPGSAILLVRSRLDPGAVMNAVRREVAAVDPDQPVFTVQTIEQLQAQATWPYRIFGTLFAIFAVIALVLSSVGLYAVMAYSVTQRTPEIGVRMALGAKRGQISWLVLRRGVTQMALGLGLGLAGAFGVSQVLTRVLAQVSPTDPVTFVTITLLLAAVALSACVIPARRASRVDPLIALRK